MWGFSYLLEAEGHVRLLLTSGIVTILILALVLIMVPYISRKSGFTKGVVRTRMSFGVLLLWYLFFTACMTVFFRNPSDTTHVELSPFWSYSEAFREGGLKNIYEVINNILFFVPLGVLVPLAFGSHVCRRPMLFTVLFGLVVSIIVETTQYCTMRGFCETDDVIHNVIGTAIGYVIFDLVYRIISRFGSFFKVERPV